MPKKLIRVGYVWLEYVGCIDEICIDTMCGAGVSESVLPADDAMVVVPSIASIEPNGNRD